MPNSTFISSLIFLIIAVGAWVMVGNINDMDRFFPRVIAVMLGAFSLLQMVVSLVQRQKEAPFAELEVKSILAMFVGIIVYVALMVYFGFVMASIVFLSFFFWFLGRNKEFKVSPPKALLLAVGVSAGFYSLFHYVFLVPLPMGVFFGG